MPTTSELELPVAAIRSCNSDFRVDEQLGFEPDGSGEHLLLRVSKDGLNTADLIHALSRQTSVAPRQICWSGMKDRHAVTSQWLSLPWPIKRDLPDIVGGERWHLEELRRHGRRLRPGTHHSNRFRIVLRECGGDQQAIEVRARLLQQRGFPNYFGAQRFGRNAANLQRAAEMFNGQRVKRAQRGIYLSAARAKIFNDVLARRVTDQNWCSALPGDVYLLEGSNSRFSVGEADNDLHRRISALDISPSGPLFGAGPSPAVQRVAALEDEIFEQHLIFCGGLTDAGLKHERRALRALASEFSWRWLEDQVLELNFTLRRGVFATALLQEIATVKDLMLTKDTSQGTDK